MRDFTYAGSPARIVFGEGSIAQLPACVAAVDARRTVILTTASRETEARALAERLGPRSAGVFAGAAMHTPVEVTRRAVEFLETCEADCLVSFGGGSATGLGKALALRTQLPQIAIPTTYAGSEVTPILGETEGGRKTTLRDLGILPATVIYDPLLTVDLPVATTVTSGLNALAHAFEALYARDRNPVSSLMAIEGIRVFRRVLPILVSTPGNREARAEALYAAWLCGSVLGTVGMALHHKLCHVIGGCLDTPHAETHAILLPHTIAFNAAALAPEALSNAGFPAAPIGGELHDFAAALGAPLALRDLGVAETDLETIVAAALDLPYWNPTSVTADGLRALLRDAWSGRRPDRTARQG